MKRIDEAGNLDGKRVLVRVDFNVPLKNGIVQESFRIEKAFQTIDYILERGGKAILASHFEGEGGTLAPIAAYLSSRYKIHFVKSYFPEISELQSEDKEVILLENTRLYSGEKENSDVFAKHLALFADIYVNEAFPSSHRAHASIVGIPKYIPGFAGFSFMKEIEELSKALHPNHPFVFILGGAKFETKLPLIEKFFTIADTVFIGGALANDFLKARGFEVGKSLVSNKIHGIEKFTGEKIQIPMDVVVSRNGTRQEISVSETEKNDVIVDVGPKTIELLADKIRNAKSILWNGPLGNFENGYKESTLNLAKIIAQSSGESIVGGGDTVASIAELGLTDSFTFISAGGGAMLEFLANETLPGIEALQ